MLALSAMALAVVASVLLLHPADVEVESGEDFKASILSGSADSPEIQDGAVRMVARYDYVIRHAEQPPTESPSRRVSRDYADADEYLDPDVLYPASPAFGSVTDAGVFLDPDRDIPPPVPADGVADVGDYVAPEEGP